MTASRPPTDEASRSVFRAPDQLEIIERLDALDDDDVVTGFFSTSAQEAEAAAVRMFDVGIRTLGSPQAPPSSFPSRSDTTFDESRVAEPSPALVPHASTDLRAALDAPAVRAAFILGGPAALGLSG